MPLYGAAVFVYSEGQLLDCVVTNNTAAYRGAGVSLHGETALVRGCTIAGNMATNDTSNGGGAGVLSDYENGFGRVVDTVISNNIATFATASFCVGSFEGCTIVDNRIESTGHGASGLRAPHNNAFTVSNCVVRGNSNAGGWGGGILLSNGTRFRISDSRIEDNVTSADGAGIYVQVSTGTIERCVITGNRAIAGSSSRGGGIHVNADGASVTINDCTFSNNAAYYGAGLDIRAGKASITNCSFLCNNASAGAGVRVSLSAVFSADDCLFEGNNITNSNWQPYHAGGGILCQLQNEQGYCAVSNCVFRGNASKFRGGGFAVTWENAGYGEVVNCIFTNNTANMQGGGLLLRENVERTTKPFLIRNCLFAGNRTVKITGDSGSDRRGAGVYFVSYAHPILESCTITGNDTADGTIGGGGLYHRWGGTVTNCVIANNTWKGTLETGSGWCYTNDSNSAYSHCCVWPALETVFLESNGCRNADPMFVDPENGDYSLAGMSPCRNKGIALPWMLTATDLAGLPRIFGGNVDMGAYERVYQIGSIMQIR